MLRGLPDVFLQHGFASEPEALADGAVLPANIVLQLPVPAAPVRAALAGAGIETRAWYCPPLHRQPAFVSCPLADTDGSPILLTTDHLAAHSLGLPWHTRLTEADMAQVVNVLRKLLTESA